MGCSLTLLLLIENGLLFVVPEIFKPVTFNLWNQSVNRIRSKVGSVIHNLINIVWGQNWRTGINSWGNLESRSVLNPVLIFRIRYNNSRSGVCAFSNGHYKFSIGGQLIFTVNKWINEDPSGSGINKLICGFFSDYQGWASILFKRTFHSFRSFPFFIKECSVLSVLFRSL